MLNSEKYKIQGIMRGISKNADPALYEKWNSIKKRKIKLAKQYKQELQDKLAQAVEYNKTHSIKRLRKLSESALVDYSVISMFESTLTRTIGMKTDELSMDLVVVKTYYFSILEDIIANGFMLNGNKYCYFASSAGQIRTKRSIFIREDLYQKYEKTFMCGLTVDRINELGGCNTNKFNSYLALLNSSTDVWEGFDITKAIVVDDFETKVNGLVDFIDEKTYTIERKRMDVPIAHTDGAGIFLPRLGKRACIVRSAWIKGLLVPFAFDAFVREFGSEGNIKDIWGKEYNIFRDGIQVIFTKSQFKMYPYYSSWDEYVGFYKQYGCEFGYCKEEEIYIKDSVINYQELQTLHDMTDDELYKITARSNQRIRNICSNIDSMLKIFDATEDNRHRTYFQDALLVYPELLTDAYAKNTIREIKNSLLQSYWSGRLEVDGKYLYLIPDLFAAASYWFLGDKNPKGLLTDGEVYSKTYRNCDEMDILRSPHLFMEHSPRTQKTNKDTDRWFIANGVYTSCHDLITKVLQNDVDGDISLCIADKTIIECAKRHIKEYNIVPLFYNMSKASPQNINSKSIYDGLIASYTAPSIGEISNRICKIWNEKNFDNECLETIKYLCLQNNFSIDFAKTLIFPEPPKIVDEQIKSHTKSKLPRFFMHLKDKNKNESQVERDNGTTVNRIRKVIKNVRIQYPKNRLAKLDYRVLMKNPDIEPNTELCTKYHNLNCKYHYKINHKNPEEGNISYIISQIKRELSLFGYCEEDVTDMLVKYLFEKKSKGKASLWMCYGDIIVKNIKANLNDWFLNCCECGKRFIAKTCFDKYCDDCKEQYSNIEMIVCIDCGMEFAHDKNGQKPLRCPVCNQLYQNHIKKMGNRERRRR